MNTTENNKLIAEFMGRSISPITLAEFRKLKPRDKHLVSGAFVEDLQYHSDWNWLMEVVNKVNRTIGVKTIDECTKEEWVVYGMVKSLYLGTPIDYVYNACVQFVQWYNKNK
jgi:hypothetical protein